MGEPDIFTLQFNTFFGVGISFEFVQYGVSPKKVFELNISLPFLFIGIYFSKTEKNDWFSFLNKNI